MKEMVKIETYLHERGLEYKLGREEVPCAVFWLSASANAKSIQKLGTQLKDWVIGTPGVRILGLEQLLEGNPPEVSALLLGIPYCPTKPETCIEKVALVVTKGRVNTEGLVTSLCDLVEHSGIANVSSWEQYSYMTR